MRILFLALGDRTVASSRIRAWVFADQLTRHGHFAVALRGASVAALKALMTPHRWDVIVVQKWVPPKWMIPLIRLRSKHLIYDCDDAIYLIDEAKARIKASDRDKKNQLNAERVARRLPQLLRVCDSFTTSTSRILSDLTAFCSKPGLVFPGPMPDRDSSAMSPAGRRGVVWLGSPATEAYLARLAPELSSLSEPLRFTAMGASHESEKLGIHTAIWTEDDESKLLRDSRAGLFIQPSGDWEDRKSGYKILEYIASGVIPVAERTHQVENLLPENYPFYFEPSASPSEIIDVVRDVFNRPPSELDEMIASLNETTRSHFSYDSTIRRWTHFLTRRSRDGVDL